MYQVRGNHYDPYEESTAASLLRSVKEQVNYFQLILHVNRVRFPFNAVRMCVLYQAFSANDMFRVITLGLYGYTMGTPIGLQWHTLWI